MQLPFFKRSLLTFREEEGPCSILADIEVLPQLAARLKPEHGVVIQAIIPEQDDASRLQHLRHNTVVNCIIVTSSS